jgi:hypothetical protein
MRPVIQHDLSDRAKSHFEQSGWEFFESYVDAARALFVVKVAISEEQLARQRWPVTLPNANRLFAPRPKFRGSSRYPFMRRR